MVKIQGNTYPVREKLKALGCKWDAGAQCWWAPEAVAEQAKALVPADSGRRCGTFRRRTCAACGCGINYGIYCGKCEFGR